VFVSSNRWDIMGAASFGFRAVWVNRAQMPQEYPHQPPAHTVSELSALPSLVL
jgi:2-haloacid dehalogenase